MTDFYSSSTSSSSIVRKFTDSVVIGSHEQMRVEEKQSPSKSEEALHQAVRDPQAQQQAKQQTKKPRVVSCHFEMEIPTNALRMDMSIIVSSNDNHRICSYDEMTTRTNSSLLPRPSVTYKITICTPRRQKEEASASASAAAAAAAHEEQSTTSTTITTTTFRYSSKFTIAKDIDDNIVPYHEWNGSFTLGAKKNTPLPLEECSFHQVQGIFTANYDKEAEEDQTTTTTTASSSTSRKLKKNFNDRDKEENDNDDDSLVPPRKKQRHHNNVSNQQQQQQRQQNLVVT